MAIADLTDWIDENTRPSIVWFIKRLSGNDTLANETHQAGPYIPKEFLFKIFPNLNRAAFKNPDIHFNLYIDSHCDYRKIRAVWYNNKLHGNPRNGRNEARLTGFGGGSSALLDPGSTGALTIFAFHRESEIADCPVWVCRHEPEEDVIEDRIGPIEPGKLRIWSVDEESFLPTSESTLRSCWLSGGEIPEGWREKFPSTEEIVEKTLQLRPEKSLAVDERLIRRRDCEFEMFSGIVL